MKQKLENQLLIQFPDELCEQISKGIDSGKVPIITLHPVKKMNNKSNTNSKQIKTETEYQREFELQISTNNKSYPTKLMDLPCVIESQKTYNKNMYFKTGDISQMLIVSKDRSNTNNDGQYILDSGITPPSSDIRERWSHVRPICHHDDIDINDYCSKCHNIPRGLINKVSKEIHNRMHGQASETWDLITHEEWIEVTDNSESEDDDAQMDRKLKNSQTINNEWENFSDDDMNNNNNDTQLKKNINNSNNSVNVNNNVKKERVFNKNENKKRELSKKREINNRNNSMNRSQKNSLLVRPLSQITGSNKRMGKSNTVSIQRGNTMSAQPPLPFISPMSTTISQQRRSTPRRTTPRRNTPLIGGNNGSMNNLIKGNINRKDNKINREKKILEEKLKTKQIELKMQEDKYNKQKNRKMKLKAGKARDLLKQEIAQIQSKLKSL